MTDFLIIANGPFLAKSKLLTALRNKRSVALDGAVNQLLKYSIKPDVILGDFDSIDAASREAYGVQLPDDSAKPYLGNDSVWIVPAMDQNFTDLEKAIRFCDSEGAESITIVCASGGREDHYEGLRLTLKESYKPARKIIVHSDYGSLCYAEDETVVIKGYPGANCGFVAFNSCAVTSEGLQYPCAGYSKSIANKMLGNTAKLIVTGGALIFLPAQLLLF